MKKHLISIIRIDKKVYLTITVLCIISIIALAFRFKNHHACESVELLVQTSVFKVGRPVQFDAKCKNGKTYDWNFGDNNKINTTTGSVIHTYQAAGKFIVTVTVNHHCEEVQKLFIQEAPKIVGEDLLPSFTSPDTALANTPVTCKDVTHNAISWEWKFGESGGVDATSREPVYIYKTSGIKTIYLKVNGRSDQVTARIIYIKEPVVKKEVADPLSGVPAGPALVKGKMPLVKNKPENPSFSEASQPDKKDEPKPKAPEISNDQMSAGLMDILAGQKTPDDFAKYMCGDMNITVVYNGSAITFLKMCDELKAYKKVKKIQPPQVLLTIEGATGCVKTMNVTVKKKGLLNRIF